MTNEELRKELLNKERKNKLPSPYNKFVDSLYGDYYLSITDSILRKKYEIFDFLPHLDHVVELTSSQMPIDYIIKSTRGKNEIIPNINQRDINENYNTVFERITKTELLGCFAKVNAGLIKELKDNNFVEYKYKDSNGEEINIKVDELLNKKVIFMCPENIETTCNNLLALQNEELIKYLGENKDSVIINTLKEYIKSLFFISDNNEVDYSELLKFVFYHEYGHCAFYDKNSDNKNNNTIIHERQANYYASIILNGQYDLLIEILNNRIGKQYKNPLLKSHEYTKGIIEFKKEEEKLYE